MEEESRLANLARLLGGERVSPAVVRGLGFHGLDVESELVVDDAYVPTGAEAGAGTGAGTGAGADTGHEVAGRAGAGAGAETGAENMIDGGSKGTTDDGGDRVETETDDGSVLSTDSAGLYAKYAGLRLRVWQVALGVLPEETARWGAAEDEAARTYRDFVDLFTREGEFPPADSESEEFTVYTQIRADVERTWPKVPFFQVGDSGLGEEEERFHDESLTRILWVYAKLNSGIAYVQGMNELVAMLLFVAAVDTPEGAASARPMAERSASRATVTAAEPRAFWLFTNLMSEIKELFVSQLDYSDSGVMGAIKAIEAELQWFDFELFEHLQKNHIDPRFYAFRWLTLLLTQEFPFATSLRLWDALFCDGHRFAFLRHFCVAMLIAIRARLLDAEFAAMVSLLQHYPPEDEVPFAVLFELACSIADRSYRSLATYDKVCEGPLDRQMGTVEWVPFWAVLALAPSRDRATIFLYKEKSKTAIDEAVDLRGATLESLTVRQRNTSKGARQAFRLATTRGNLYLGTFNHLSPRLEWMAAFARVLDTVTALVDARDASAVFDICAWDATYGIAPPRVESDPTSPLADSQLDAYYDDRALWDAQLAHWPLRASAAAAAAASDAAPR
ncbi:RabGAP/TBC protein [Thecamonas trahens ATCC 50062]|uniref:RabGAP/TBC protein n=1 Tax=Thecamonas trahens ATCC 50062 TaxID=461836 RepID=A0A0L0DNN8_THETB|nr:RabGAP/TBC protein [Thecamonas trahens ATCC 50062]KNC53880.1 RabGAP/TBC protein [Thecamonas trahens ATCC 50062]|eukprot:XP_013754256.1 RabGAP/TBC protein [Thecamonas trahens ATCC 50062]